jgi:4-nitrophenyl phosphatase
LYVTNNSRETAESVAERLRVIDPNVTPDDAVTSSQVAANECSPGERVVVFGEAGVSEPLSARGCVLVDNMNATECDAVVVGLHNFDYQSVARASRLILGGARFIASNVDPQYPTEDGVMPGNGSVVAAIAVVTAVDPQVCGKPFPTMVAYVRKRCEDQGLKPPSAVIGDQLATDGEFAAALGVPFGLVLTGVTNLALGESWAKTHTSTAIAADVLEAASAVCAFE